MHFVVVFKGGEASHDGRGLRWDLNYLEVNIDIVYDRIISLEIIINAYLNYLGVVYEKEEEYCGKYYAGTLLREL